jgi:AbrB family looped-hinge helix DNA binding protein
MLTVKISSKGRILLPIAIRNALGLKAGMRVMVTLEGSSAGISLAPKSTLADIQALLNYGGPTVPISAMRVTNYMDCTLPS